MTKCDKLLYMKIAVYCGAASGADPSFTDAARTLGGWIAENSHELIYGAGKVGMMGAVADAVLKKGGLVTGVIPQFMIDLGWCHEGLTDCIVTQDMSARIRLMCDMADATIALPGGAGTLEEISCMFSWQRLGLNDSPIILFNTKGYYEPLRTMYDSMVSAGYLDRESLERLLFSDSLTEIADFIASFEKKGRLASGGY